MAEKKRILQQLDRDPLERIRQAGQAKLGRLYSIQLKDARILEASTVVTREATIQLLSGAEVSPVMINRFTRTKTVQLDDIANLLRHSEVLGVNAREYITKTLGYDAMRIREDGWNNWDYYSSALGLG